MVEKFEQIGEKAQTGVRINKNMLKVLKGLAEYQETLLGDLLELIITESFEGTSPFSDDDFKVINTLISIYGLKDTKVLKDTKLEKEPDTIVVPANEDGFNKVFLGQNCWYSVSIADSRIDKIKWIAGYQTAPYSAITYLAEIDRIERYENTNKYIIYFKEKAKKIGPIKNEGNRCPMRSRKYAVMEKLLKAKTVSEVFSK